MAFDPSGVSALRVSHRREHLLLCRFQKHPASTRHEVASGAFTQRGPLAVVVVGASPQDCVALFQAHVGVAWQSFAPPWSEHRRVHLPLAYWQRVSPTQTSRGRLNAHGRTSHVDDAAFHEHRGSTWQSAAAVYSAAQVRVHVSCTSSGRHAGALRQASYAVAAQEAPHVFVAEFHEHIGFALHGAAVVRAPQPVRSPHVPAADHSHDVVELHSSALARRLHFGKQFAVSRSHWQLASASHDDFSGVVQMRS